MSVFRPRRVLTSAGAFLVLALGFGVMPAMPAMAAVPANDAFANARPVGALPAVITGNNADATKQGQDPASECTLSEKTTWYWLSVPHAAYILVDTHGSQHNTGVSIWRGSSLATLSEVACSYGSEGNPGGGFFGRLTFRAVGGARYYVRVSAGSDGISTPGGATKLSIRRVTPPANDNAASAKPITSLPFEGTASNVRATTQQGERRTGPCFNSMATIWYRVHPASTMTLRADTFGSSFDTVLGVLQGGPSLPDMAYAACDDDTSSQGDAVVASSVTWHALAGRTYWIQIGGYDNETGSIHFNLASVKAPANDDRAKAKVIPNVSVATFSASVSTRNATPQQGETIDPSCGQSDDVRYPQSVWYRYTAPNTDGVLFTSSMSGEKFPVLSIYTGSSFGSQHAVACNSSGSLALEPQAGQTYYIQLAGITGRSGTYQLTAAPEH